MIYIYIYYIYIFIYIYYIYTNINPYYWVDDHPLLYGNIGSLDLTTYILMLHLLGFVEGPPFCHSGFPLILQATPKRKTPRQTPMMWVKSFVFSAWFNIYSQIFSIQLALFGNYCNLLRWLMKKLLGNTSMLQIDLFMHRTKHISHDCSTNQRLPFFEQLGPTKLYGNIWNPR